jgi:hypothetical protein
MLSWLPANLGLRSLESRWSVCEPLTGIIGYFEIGIRMALGASRGRVVAAMLGNACLMLGIGLVAGTALALPAGRGASTLLFGLKSWDPVTLAGAAALLALVTVVQVSFGRYAQQT